MSFARIDRYTESEKGYFIFTYNAGFPLKFSMSLSISRLRMTANMAKYVNQYSCIESCIFQLHQEDCNCLFHDYTDQTSKQQNGT